jgi:hypothetical protein
LANSDLPNHPLYAKVKSAFSANLEIGSPRKILVHGVANSDLPQHLLDAFQTVLPSLPIRRLAAHDWQPTIGSTIK